jgi:flagellin
MTVIGTNSSALRASNASASSSKALSTAMERLSTGKRINSAKDDAAGLAISSQMTAQIKGMTQGIRNANDGLSMAQTAEGALSEVSNMLQRMRELTVQGLNGTNDTKAQGNIKTEIDQLGQQINDVISKTQFNGKDLFSASAPASVSIQSGSNASDTVTLTLGALDLSAVATATGGTLSGTVAAPAFASTDLAAYDTALETVATKRATLGAAQNRLESAVANMTNNVTNMTDARSRIEDADYSAETTALAKAQILSQASTAMLAQANQSQQNVLKLIQ